MKQIGSRSTDFIAPLEALRGIAAWMVVLHHLRPALGTIWHPLGATPVFAAGVDLFFILSGVVMVMVAERAPTPFSFLAARAARVLPLYWLVTGVIVAMLLAGLHPLGIGAWDVGDVWSSLMLWPALRADGQPGPLLTIGWTLMFEAVFYVIFALALTAQRLKSAPTLTAAAIIGLLTFGAVGAPQTLPLSTWTAPILGEFLLGLLIGMWWCRYGYRLTVSRWLPALCAVLAINALIWASGSVSTLIPGALIPPTGYASVYRVIAFGLPMAIIVLAALLADAANLRPGRLLLAAGVSSYSTYLSHMLVIQIVGKVTGEGAALLLALPIIALVSVPVHHWVEKPLTRTARRLLTGRTNPARRIGSHLQS